VTASASCATQRSRREGGGEQVEVERAAGLERHVHRARVRQDRVGAVVLIERLEHDHLVAGVHQREQRRDHRLGGAAGDGDLALGIGLEPVALRVHPRQHVAEPVGTPGDRVLVDVGPDGADCCLLEGLGRWKIGEALGEIEGVVLTREPRHAPDHRLAEAVGASGCGH
jgi:hypothetical protein